MEASGDHHTERNRISSIGFVGAAASSAALLQNSSEKYNHLRLILAQFCVSAAAPRCLIYTFALRQRDLELCTAIALTAGAPSHAATSEAGIAMAASTAITTAWVAACVALECEVGMDHDVSMMCACVGQLFLLSSASCVRSKKTE